MWIFIESWMRELCDLVSVQSLAASVTSGYTPSFSCGRNQVQKEILAPSTFFFSSGVILGWSSFLPVWTVFALPSLSDRSALNQSFLFSLSCLNLASWPYTIGLGTTDPGTPQETSLVINLLAPFTTASCPLPAQKLRALPCLSGPHMSKTGVCGQKEMENAHANKEEKMDRFD